MTDPEPPDPESPDGGRPAAGPGAAGRLRTLLDVHLAIASCGVGGSLAYGGPVPGPVIVATGLAGVLAMGATRDLVLVGRPPGPVRWLLLAGLVTATVLLY